MARSQVGRPVFRQTESHVLGRETQESEKSSENNIGQDHPRTKHGMEAFYMGKSCSSDCVNGTPAQP